MGIYISIFAFARFRYLSGILGKLLVFYAVFFTYLKIQLTVSSVALKVL